MPIISVRDSENKNEGETQKKSKDKKNKGDKIYGERVRVK